VSCTLGYLLIICVQIDLFSNLRKGQRKLATQLTINR